VLAALELLKRTRETGAFKVLSIDVSKAYCLVATDQKRAQLTFGLDDITGQLDRLSAVRGEAALIGQEIQTINLIRFGTSRHFHAAVPAENDDALDPAPPRAVVVKGKSGNDATSSTKDKTKPAAKPGNSEEGEGRQQPPQTLPHRLMAKDRIVVGLESAPRKCAPSLPN